MTGVQTCALPILSTLSCFSFGVVFKVFAVTAGGKKKQLNVDKPDEDFIPADRYDALDDYDFM